jgi:hypothetical protein
VASVSRARSAPARQGGDVVREPRRRLQVVARRRRRLWLATTVASLVFVAMAGLIVVQLRTAAAQRELDRIRAERTDTIAYNERLKLIVDQLQAPETVVNQAVGLGLTFPGNRTRLVPQSAQLAEAAAGPAGTVSSQPIAAGGTP